MDLSVTGGGASPQGTSNTGQQHTRMHHFSGPSSSAAINCCAARVRCCSSVIGQGSLHQQQHPHSGAGLVNHNPNKKKSRSELKCIVSESRRQIMTSMSSMVPANVNFRRLADGRVRIYFLGTPPNGYEHTLLYVDVNPNSSLSNVQPSSASQSTTTSTTSAASMSNSTATTATNTTTTTSSSNSITISSCQMAASSIAAKINGLVTTTAELMDGTLSSVTTSFGGGMSAYQNQQQHQENSEAHQHQQSSNHQQQRHKLQWNLVLEPTISSLNNNNAPCSREVQLLLERKRLSTWGLTSYELHKDSGKIVYPSASTLYQCLDTGFSCGPIFPSELRISSLWVAFDPQICPQNSDLVAYVCGGDIWCTHTVSGHVERLTYARDGHRPFAEDPLNAGVPSYVIQEEFNRYQGFWWQPHSEDGVYRIAYEEVDESDVGLVTFPTSATHAGDDYEEYRFPKAGTPNAKSKLKMVQFRLSETLQIAEVSVRDLRCPLSSTFPWMEYLVRVGWTPDSKFVWAQVLNRLQQRLDVVLIPLDNFCELYSSPPESPSKSTIDKDTAESGVWRSPLDEQPRFTPMQVLYSQTSATWVNVHEILHFIEVTDTRCTLIWASEETGFRHLYLITCALDLAPSAGDFESHMMDDEQADVLVPSSSSLQTGGGGSPERRRRQHILRAQVINKVALTAGEWEVLGSRIWLDKERHLVYFQGLRETPLEKHLYVVSLQQPGHIRLLSAPGSSYTVQFSDDCSVLLQTYCNIHTRPTCEVVRLQQRCEAGGVNGLALSSLGYLLTGGAPENSRYCPTIYTEQLQDGSETIYAMVFKPHNFRLGVKYPTVLSVYGGPEVQIVNNTFKGIRQLRMHMLALQGYCVVCIDSRGSHHRGVRFESHLRRRMGTVELTDQVEILKKLSSQLGYIDMERVAIFGWSYGGYLSLLGLAHHPDVFKVAIAGAPVTNWEYYDTGYTERYMDLPVNNKEGYNSGSVLRYVNKFPDEENRLLIIHGLIDENVHFSHTTQLIDALVKLNKPYQLQVYPHERHSLRNVDASKHYETTLLSFLQNNL